MSGHLGLSIRSISSRTTIGSYPSQDPSAEGDVGLINSLAGLAIGIIQIHKDFQIR